MSRSPQARRAPPWFIFLFQILWQDHCKKAGHCGGVEGGPSLFALNCAPQFQAQPGICSRVTIRSFPRAATAGPLLQGSATFCCDRC